MGRLWGASVRSKLGESGRSKLAVRSLQAARIREGNNVSATITESVKLQRSLSATGIEALSMTVKYQSKFPRSLALGARGRGRGEGVHAS